MTAAQLTFFEVVGSYYDVEAPLTSGTTNTPQLLVISGFVTFTPRVPPGTTVYVANLDLGSKLVAPANVAVTASGTGGTLAAGATSWAVTTTTPSGETTASNIVTASLSGSTSSAVLTWDAVPNASGYKVYRTAPTPVLLATISSGSTVTFTDTGSAGTSASPPGSNTAELTQNTAVALAPIQGRIYEGSLSTIDQADATGVQLLANTTAISSSLVSQDLPSTASGLAAGTLVYDVSFSNVVYANNTQVLKNFAFTAPTTNTVVDLGDPTLTRLEYDPTGY